MAVTIKVKSADAVRVQREAVARRVVAHFGSCVPAESKLLCFLDDEDPPEMRREFGDANRGGYCPINDDTKLVKLPSYIFADEGVSLLYPRVIDGVIYLYGSTCADDVGLTMTLAHELQHVIQHANALKLWAVNSVISRYLDSSTIAALNLKWTDIPIEVEARIVSKRVAVMFFGEQRVQQYIDHKIAEHVTDDDVADWQFVRTLAPLSSIDLGRSTHQLLQRLKGYESELEWALRIATRNSPHDYKDVDLAPFFAEV